MYVICYLLLILIGTTIVIINLPRISIWWIAFYSAAIYSLPILFGFDTFGREIDERAIVWMLFVQTCLLSMALFRGDREARAPQDLKYPSLLPAVSTVLAVIVLGVVIFDAGFRIFQVHKLESNLNPIFYIGWRISASFAFLVGVVLRKKCVVATSALILLSTFFAGDRTAIGLAIIATVWFKFSSQVHTRRKVIVGAALAGMLGFIIFFGKLLQVVILTQGEFSIADAVTLVSGDIKRAVMQTEPWATIGVFSAILGSEIVAPIRLFFEAFAQIFPLPSLLGISSASFNDFYQPLLFPDYRERSLAYSYWGEAYSYFGYAGLVIFLVIFLFGLEFFSRLTRSIYVPVKVLGYLGGAYWAFHIHRNSIASILAYERHIIMFVAAISVIAIVFSRTRKKSGHL